MDRNPEPATARLPDHGRISCALCFGSTPIVFDETRTGNQNWRITNNPCAWGNPMAEILVLGFSKGPTQAGALGKEDHDLIAAKGARTHVRRVLHSIGLVAGDQDMDALIADRTGRFAFGSLIRCTVEQRSAQAGNFSTVKGAAGWVGTGGNMLGGFIDDPWGKVVVRNCVGRFLGNLPCTTKLVVLFGFGKNGVYVDQAERAIREIRGSAQWRRLNEVAYTDGRVTFVHVEHFRSQGRLIPDWLGERRKDGSPPSEKRVRWRLAAVEAVGSALRSVAHLRI
jgi:hypothetical protein